MLTFIHIKNFAIISELELDLSMGFTVVTGETGAGKSIIIDALELALGDRADVHAIRAGAERCEITLQFDLKNIPAAQQWLAAQEYTPTTECIIRRIINQDGRSRAQINGTTCPLQAVRELSPFLINIHGQHEHQSLLKKEHQLALLDNFANHPDLLQKMQVIYEQWRQHKNRLEQLIDSAHDQAKIKLLQYQVQELTELALQEGEWEALDQSHKKLANAENLTLSSHTTLDLLADHEQASVLTLLNNSLSILQPIKQFDSKLQNAATALEQALILVKESHHEIQHYIENFESDPAKLQQIEQRLTQIHHLARKHHITPTELLPLQQQLSHSLEQLQSADEQAKHIRESISQLENDYRLIASRLTLSRKQAAESLAQAVSQQIHSLGMPGGQFAVHFSPLQEISTHGLERIEFTVSANPGQPLQSLQKVASGGELSRISLAIQVIAAQQEDTPTLIFDEVDVGIGGNIAAIVGRLLRNLGKKAQVICITHQPQVAAQGQQHLQVSKTNNQGKISTAVSALFNEKRIAEIARMLSGIKITAQTLAHAQELMEENNDVAETSRQEY